MAAPGKKRITPARVEKLRILDPACGSGSFLIGAYQYLLDWHRNWYVENDAAKHARGRGPKIHRARGGDWRLTTAERKRILLNNIHGVDIDPQAVEVTKLSLLLKVLEGESQETLQNQLRLVHERALPDLSSNIKCGNSLIGSDFYENRQMSLLDEEEMYRINVFDWKAEFPDIFKGKNPGFDAVIGNPPYLYSADRKYSDYLNAIYQFTQYQTDYYVYFIEKALRLGRAGARVSFIVSDSWLNSEYFSKIREHILTSHRIEVVAVFDYPVFKKVTLENSIFLVTVSAPPCEFPIERFRTPEEHSVVNSVAPENATRRGLIDPHYSSIQMDVVSRVKSRGTCVDSVVKVNRGIHAYRTDGYGQSKYGPGPQTERDKKEQSYHCDQPLNRTYLPEVRGKNVFRYKFCTTGKYVSYGDWLAEPRSPEFFYSPKVVLRKILGDRLHGTFIEKPFAIDQSLYILISTHGERELLKHILGVLCSRIGAWYLRTKYSIYDKLYPWYTKKQLAEFPMPAKDDRLVELVDRMLDLEKRADAVKTAHEKAVLQRQIAATDRQIDRLVYELYELTEEEIGIVEQATG